MVRNPQRHTAMATCYGASVRLCRPGRSTLSASGRAVTIAEGWNFRP